MMKIINVRGFWLNQQEIHGDDRTFDDCKSQGTCL